MLNIIVSGELFNEITEEFITIESIVLELEHSLVSLSKWESKYQKPFLVPGEKSTEEIFGYFEAMTLTSNVSDVIFKCMTPENIDEINEYIGSTQSATTFYDPRQNENRGRPEIVTSELIYYWMASYGIPLECQDWHLNRLFAFLRIFGIKNSKQKKMSKSEMAARNAALNAERRAQMGTSG